MTFYDEYDEDAELDCNYGLGFCSEPCIKRMGLCTTDCSDYLENCEEMGE